MKAIHFTIEPTNSGFTDQLMQFSAFYKLGLYLGFHYLHTPFFSGRSNASNLLSARVPDGSGLARRLFQRIKERLVRVEGPVAADVHEFIGINSYFVSICEQSLPAPQNAQQLAIDLSDTHLRELGLASFNQLVDYLGSLSRQFADDSEVVSINPALIKFRLSGPRTDIFSLIQANIPEFPDGLNLPEICSTSRARVPVKPLFRKRGRGLKILLHVRQGDIGVIRTPWNTFMPVWSLRKDRLKEYDSFDQIESATLLFEVAEYKSFLDAFVKRLDQPYEQILVFSDGAKRGLRIVESCFNSFDWPVEKVERFRQSMSKYDERQFRCFSTSRDVQLHVGEEPRKLLQLINSAIEADVIIVSTQQRMMPKLVALLCSRQGPKVIVLYKQNIPVNSDIIYNDQERFIYVDIRNPDFDSLIQRIKCG